MTAPNRDEIRQAIALEVEAFPALLDDLFYRVADPIADSPFALTRRGWAPGFHPDDDHPGTLWADLTGDEEEDLEQLVDAARRRWENRVRRALVDELTRAGVAFAKRHPDVPRGKWPIAPAEGGA